MSKKLAIVGSAAGREDAPFSDLDYDIWVFNEAAQSDWCKRFDTCFQMHVPAIYTGHNTKNPLHWEWLQQSHNARVVMQSLDERVPDCYVYPINAAKALIGGRNYLASTVSYALALAIIEGFTEIHIYGVELSASEYMYQAECYRFWVGRAMGAGRLVFLHSGEALFTAPLYGYDGNFAFGSEYFSQQAATLDNEWYSAEKNLKNIKRAIEKAILSRDAGKVQALVKTFHEAAMFAGEKAGALAEAERYTGFGDRGADRGGFEFAAASAQRDGEEKRIAMYMQLGKVEYIWNVCKQSKFNPQAVTALTSAIASLGEMSYATGAHLGMYRENMEYIQKYDATVQANGMVKV